MLSLHKISLPQALSTNSWLLEALAQGRSFEVPTVVYTLCQTQGRGQVGNVWESEPGKNIALSLLLRPSFLPLQHQFQMSQVCCLGVVDAIRQLLEQDERTKHLLPLLCVKWPNDIYLGDEKLGGILIENRLMGALWAECVLGIGINVGQLKWLGDAPNPTSLLLHGVEVTPEDVLDAVCQAVLRRYELLQAQPEEYAEVLQQDFLACLYRREGWHPYVDAKTGESFQACIAGVDSQGPLVLLLPDGELRHYWFKEVRFVLPCGVTKE